MNSFKLYFRLAWFLKTPFILLLDTHYKLIPYRLIKELCEAIGLVYGEFTDCTAFAWVFKALAYKRGFNGIGFILGRHRGWHNWNVALVKYSLCQIEPQNGVTFKKLEGYRAWFVIM